MDAGAANIDVSLDLSCFKIRVSDDGRGIGREDLLRVGDRHLTSKCRTLEDLDRLETIGHRGEALASIRDVSGYLQIVSKTVNGQYMLIRL